MSEHATFDADTLRSAIAGEVVTASESGWDAARQAWNLTADQHPALVVQPADAGDVAAVVRFARASGLRVAPQASGHGARTLGDLGGAILLRTGRLAAVDVDTVRSTARVGAGARWRDVVPVAGEHGLVALHGFSPTVGVAGYLLGGGIGWLARRDGFASSHVRSFEVVTADGEQRHVDAGSEPDLYWALRGGGGSPALVTAFEIELFPLREAFAGSLMWPIEQAGEIVHAYREWITGVPDTLTSVLRLTRFPPLPELPEPLRGKAFVSVALAFAGSEAEGNALVAPLRAVAAPAIDTLATVPGTALAEISGDPPGPLPGIGDGRLLAVFTAEVADAYVALAGPDAEIPLVQLEIRHLGGALRTPVTDAGAAGALDAAAVIYGVGMPTSPAVGGAIDAALATVRERLAPWAATRGTLLTFDERSGGVGDALDPGAAERLARIASAWDPDGLLLANHVPGA